MELPSSPLSPDACPRPPLCPFTLGRTWLLWLLGLGAFQLVKNALWPHLTPGQGQAVTVVCGSLAATVASAREACATARRKHLERQAFDERVETERVLRDREEQYRLAFEYATHGMYRTTPDGQILLANPALLEMLGYDSFDALATRNLEARGTGTDYAREEFKTRLEAAGTLRGMEAVWKRQDGQPISVRENARVVRGQDGAPLWYEGSVEDITARKEAEEALRRSHQELEARVQTRTADLADANAALHQENQERRRAERQIVDLNDELVHAYDATIEGWSRALDLRDKETEGHSQRVTELTLRLACALGLPPERLQAVRRGALLHDIGKMGVPDGILLKPGPLTDDEWVIMRRHPTSAHELLSPITFLHPALDIPYCHHEKWDGTGYPQGLAGEQIPLAARIFAVVDVWDAMCSDRPYRAGWPPARVCEHVRTLSGTHFDPQVVDAFLGLMAGEEACTGSLLLRAA